MEMTRELRRDAGEIEQALAQNLRNEVRAWRRARAQRHGVTETGVPVVRIRADRQQRRAVS
jgi:hypothetical protein